MVSAILFIVLSAGIAASVTIGVKFFVLDEFDEACDKCMSALKEYQLGIRKLLAAMHGITYNPGEEEHK